MNLTKFGISALGLVVIGGCTVGPDYERPDLGRVLPETYADAAPLATDVPSQADIARWWESFGDEELTSLIRRSLSESIRLEQALERIVEARSRRGIEDARRLPTLDGSGGYTRLSTGEEGVGLQGAPPGEELDLYTAGVVAGWELDLWGRVERLVEAADADIEFAVEDYRAVRVALAGDVAREFILIRGLDLEIEAVETALETDRDNVEIASARARAGFADELDVSRSQRVLDRNLATLPDLRGQRRDAEIRLAVLLGSTPGEIAVSPSGLPRRDVLPSAGVPADLLIRRPDIRRAEQALIAATARVGANQAEYYPRVSISGTFAFEGTDVGSLVDPDSFGFSLGPSILIPIFNGGRIRSQVDVAESQQRQAVLALQLAMIDAIAEVESAAALRSRAEERATRLGAAEASATDTESFATARFEAGIVDFLDVTEARTQLLDIRRDRAVAERETLLRLVDLYVALGGGWELESIGN
ncbi:MAG: efflux transporter outer membrane subunit [Planctomycetota bacterium]